VCAVWLGIMGSCADAGEPAFQARPGALSWGKSQKTAPVGHGGKLKTSRRAWRLRWAELSKKGRRPGPHRCPVGRTDSYTQTLGFAGRFDAGDARVSAMWFGIMCSCAFAGEPPRVPDASRRSPLRWAELSKKGKRPGPHRCPVGRTDSYMQTLGSAGRFDARNVCACMCVCVWCGIMGLCAPTGEPARVPGAARRAELGRDSRSSSCGAPCTYAARCGGQT
jgi:hypothetical protein